MRAAMTSLGIDIYDEDSIADLAKALYYYEVERREESYTGNQDHNVHTDSMPPSFCDVQALAIHSTETHVRPFLVSRCQNFRGDDEDAKLKVAVGTGGIHIVFFRRNVNNRRGHAVGPGRGRRSSWVQRMKHKGAFLSWEEWSTRLASVFGAANVKFV